MFVQKRKIGGASGLKGEQTEKEKERERDLSMPLARLKSFHLTFSNWKIRKGGKQKHYHKATVITRWGPIL